MRSRFPNGDLRFINKTTVKVLLARKVLTPAALLTTHSSTHHPNHRIISGLEQLAPSININFSLNGRYVCSSVLFASYSPSCQLCPCVLV